MLTYTPPLRYHYPPHHRFREKETLARPRADVWRMWLDATTTAAQYPAFRWSTKGWATVEGMVSGVQDMEAVAA